MAAFLELLSFHFAIFFGSTILFIIQIIPYVANKGTSTVLLAWFIFCSAITAFISHATKAYELTRWASSITGQASFLCLIGHLAPISGFYIYFEMARAGAGSGLVLIPILAWGAIFYGIGVIMAIIQLGRAANI